MTIVVLSALCLIGGVALWRAAFSFTVDAAPVGSMMIVASIVLCATSIFLFGMVVGRGAGFAP